MTFIEKAGVLLRDPKKLLQFWQYSVSRLFFGHGVAKIPQGGRIRASSFSEYLAVYMLTPNEGELAMIRKFLAPAREVFDLGANVGVWTVLMSKANPRARVHSFEPNPDTFALLERNAKENNCSNVLLNRAAVSNIAGQVKFQAPKNESIYGRVTPEIEGYDKVWVFSRADSFMVPAVRLREYCEANAIEEIDFLKIDIEGHELAALRGMEPLLSQRRVKAIYMETVKDNYDRMGTRFSELLAFINDCGYRFYALSEDGGPGLPVTMDQIKTGNHLCLPR